MAEPCAGRYFAGDESSSKTPACQAGTERMLWFLLLAFAYGTGSGEMEDSFRCTGKNHLQRGGTMLYWALLFLIVAIIAAVFGFGGIALAAAGIAKILFFIFLVLFVITLITHLGRRGSNI
jgi:uncharacterized membrane protein YtjA (UPF0391 family)